MDQWVIYIALLGVLVLFIYGRWRYDVVGLGALMFVVFMGVIPQNEAFAGFGHPAVITIAAGLVVSHGLNNAGVGRVLARTVGQVGKNPTALIATLTLTTAICSAFMNNVAAVALILPVGVRLARKYELSPSIILMPLAFGSLLGGLTTLMTPPNIIVATYRDTIGRGAFAMFDFTPVGIVVMLLGVAFIALIGWRLIPVRDEQGQHGDFFQIADYVTEIRITPQSKLVDKSISEMTSIIDVQLLIITLVRGDQRIQNPDINERFQAGDRLIIQIEPDDLKELVDSMKVELEGTEHTQEALAGTGDISLIEAVVRPDSPIIGRTVQELNLRWRYRVNLIAVARQGERIRSGRLINIQFQAGDVLLLQGRSAALPHTLRRLGCLPLAERELFIDKPRRLAASLSLFGVAIALAALSIVEIQVAMICTVLGMILMHLISLKEVYEAIDWPIVILLGAMIPIGAALETTGGAQQIADIMLSLGGNLPPAVTLLVLMIISMILSDVVNNAATAVLMAPIAVNLANGFNVSPDPFLMGVAVSTACAFLTPIGHQANTLVMGPGGYRFGDYWRMGLPLMILVLLSSLVMILIVWPM